MRIRHQPMPVETTANNNALLRSCLWVALFALLCGGAASTPVSREAAPQQRELPMEVRLAAHREIERLYYAHQEGAKLPFEQALPDQRLADKVRTSLLMSMALEKFWGLRITPGMLEGELKRIASRTRMPGRLLDLYKALGNDSLLIQEAFARPALVERYAKQMFRADAGLQASRRILAERVRSALVAGSQNVPDGAELVLTAAGQATSQPRDTDWSAASRVGEANPLGPFKKADLQLDPEELKKLAPSMVCSIREDDEFFAVPLVVHAGTKDVGLEYRIGKVTWDAWWEKVVPDLSPVRSDLIAQRLSVLPLPLPGAEDSIPHAAGGSGQLQDSWELFTEPEQVLEATAIWTGTEVIVWGGYTSLDILDRGYRYDPVADTWAEISRLNAPSPRAFHTAVWTGSRMLIWGGTDPVQAFNTGGSYDPVTDTWHTMSTTGAPAPAYIHTAVWTGSEMLVRGQDPQGGRYDPVSDTWRPMSSAGAPTPGFSVRGVWTGTEFLLWGGYLNPDGSGLLIKGGRYNPATDSWALISTKSQPVPRLFHTAIWSGTEMLVWGGTEAVDVVLSRNDGARYSPATDSWSPMTLSGAPEARYLQTAIWNGAKMIVWGGFNDFFTFHSGGAYDPAQDTWTATSTVYAAPGRLHHTATWTGDLMVIWGGMGARMNTPVARYDPHQNVWLPTRPAVAPVNRDGHTAVWTGNLMLIWGGFSQVPGFRYDPLMDEWDEMTVASAPPPRWDHTAVWTGNEMIVWGGQCSQSYQDSYCTLNGRYDPVQDHWQPVSQNGEPSPRTRHVAAWTGSRMLIWGGDAGGTIGLGDGASYDPVSSTWSPISSAGAPSARVLPAGTWVGNRLLIWGGCSGHQCPSDGGLFDPESNTWEQMTTIGAPEGRGSATAVWTGREAIIWGGWGTGGFLNSGGRYNPATDTWQPTQLVGAPEPRIDHTANWIGTMLVVWGGWQLLDPNPILFSDGGRYDPVLDLWEPMASLNAPHERYSHTAVWTGDELIVWGGIDWYQGALYTGFDYRTEQSPDLDHDLYSLRAGDCDDNNPAVYPGAPEICDGARNDCSAPGWPGLSGTIETDDDGDGVSECQADCDDANNAVYPGAPQACDGLNNDCSSAGWPALANTNDSDDDQDGMSECQGDCDDADPTLYSGAVELNDGRDNQCLGDPGSGAIDEVSGLAGFDDLAHTSDFCWVQQAGAISYDVKRSGSPSFDSNCRSFLSSPGTCISDSDSPAPGTSFYYLVRAGLNYQGSWGQDSAGAERASVCSSQMREFSFVDTPADDVTDTAMAAFLNASPGSPTDYFFFEVTGSGTGRAWCSQRSDFFRDTYLALASTAGSVTSGSWMRWTRDTAGQWSGVTTSGSPNYYGEECFAPWSWCSEYGLNGLHLLVNPADASGCEIVDESAPSYCSPGTWRLRIRVGESRQAVCGF